MSQGTVEAADSGSRATDGAAVRAIDTRAMFAAKNPALAAKIPAWVYRLISRISHEQELNKALAELADLDEKDFIAAALRELGVSVECRGLEHLPREGNYTLCANHPLGGLDGLVLMHLMTKHSGGFLVTANDLLLSIPQLRASLVGINKHGSNAAQSLVLDAMYASDKPILVFPAGRTARPRGKKLADFPWSKSFVKLSRRYQRCIVPVHVSGRNSWRFYGLWRLRRILGIRVNLEMFLLVDELFRKRGTTITVRIGTPVCLPAQGSLEDDRTLADELRLYVEKLGDTADTPAPMEAYHD